MSSSSDNRYQYKYFAVTIDPDSYVAHVELNRPDKLNAINELMWYNLGEIFEQLSTDPDVRSVILSGRGDRGFSAGLDYGIHVDIRYSESIHGHFITVWPRGDFRYGQKSDRMEKAYQELTGLPVIAVLHGYSIGGAIDISSACDIRLCTTDVKFSVKETAIGLAADVGTLSRLPKLGISLSWVKEVCYMSRMFGAEEAAKVGFVGGGYGLNGVFRDKQEAMEGAMRIVSAIAGNSPVAVQGTKRLIDWSRDHSVDDGLALTAVWNSAMLQTDDIGKAAVAGMKGGAGKGPAPKFSKL